MFKKFQNRIWSLALIVSLVLSAGCAAIQAPAPNDIIGMQNGSTLYGLQTAISGIKPGVSIFMKDSTYVFKWVLPECQTIGYAAVKLASGNQTTQEQVYDILRNITGNAVSASTWSQLKGYLLQAGWTEITVRQLPAVLRSGISTASRSFSRVFVPIFVAGTAVYYTYGESLKLLDEYTTSDRIAQ